MADAIFEAAIAAILKGDADQATEIINAAIPAEQEMVSGKVIVATVEGDVHDIGKTIVGGAPVTQRWADRIGADAYAQDAGDGVRKTKELLTS